MSRTTSNEALHLYGIRTPELRGGLDLGAGPSWMTDPARACRTDNADLFFFLEGEGPELRSVNLSNQRLAKAICGVCPFQSACATLALDRGELYGVWGGYSMSSDEDRKRAAAETGWTPNPKARAKAPTQDELRSLRVAEAKTKTARVEQEIRELWQQGKPDTAIALAVGVHPRAVGRIRGRLGLAALYGATGQPINRAPVSA